MCARLFRVTLALYCVVALSGVQAYSQSATAGTVTAGRSDYAFGKPAYESDARFIAAFDFANKLDAAEQFNFAIDNYKKADKIAGGRCAECLRQIFAIQMKIGNYKDAAATAGELLTMADTPSDKSKAEVSRGHALYLEAGDKPKPAQLQAADDLLKAAIADDPKSITARFIDGTVLARMGQVDAARQQFEATIAGDSPKDPGYLRAKHFAENPALSYQKMAPSFTVAALDGLKFTLDEMGGRVVLIDFWATWCEPCNEELPNIKKIARDFAGQPLVIISVSWDEDDAKWRSFIAKNQMNWVQYRDADHALRKRFGIDAIPNYFTIDSDGVLTSEMLGSGYDVEGRLRNWWRGRRLRRRSPWRRQGAEAAAWDSNVAEWRMAACNAGASRLASNVETGLQSRCGEQRWLNL